MNNTVIRSEYRRLLLSFRRLIDDDDVVSTSADAVRVLDPLGSFSFREGVAAVFPTFFTIERITSPLSVVGPTR